MHGPIMPKVLFAFRICVFVRRNDAIEGQVRADVGTMYISVLLLVSDGVVFQVLYDTWEGIVRVANKCQVTVQGAALTGFCRVSLDFKMVNAMRVLDRHNEVPAV